MSQQNGSSHFNSRVYSENADGSQDVYMEGEEYVDYEEEYVQLADGSLVSASNATEVQAATYSVSETYQPRQNISQPPAAGRLNPTFNARRQQAVYRVVKNESIPRQTPQVYKYAKPTAPILQEEKNVPPMLSQASHQNVYHVMQQPSVSYSYESRPSSSPSSNGSFQQAYQFAQQKTYDVKPLAKQNKRKVMAGQRKPCNCTKSMCLKLYCDCFANGEFCRDCNCKDCRNNLEFEGDRTKAIKQSLERNPNAFKPKIGVSKPIGASPQDVERLHQKGCHCKKSGCLKNYCECYEAKVPCTDRCKCKGCQNTETDRAVRFKDKIPGTSLLGALSGGALSGIAAAGKLRTGHASDSDSDNDPDSNDPRGYPWFYMTDEVIDAATMCMVAQAEEALIKTDPNTEEMERLVLREFGRCLEQIITSTGTAGPSV